MYAIRFLSPPNPPPHKPGCHHEFLCPSGLFEPTEMKYDVNRNTSIDPSLAEMTEVAVKLLSRNPQGFYLFVEGE